MTRVAKKEKMFLYHKSASSSFLYYTSDWHHSQMYLKSSIWCWTTLNAYTRLSSKQSSHELTSCLALPCLQHWEVLTNYNPINAHKNIFCIFYIIFLKRKTKPIEIKYCMISEWYDNQCKLVYTIAMKRY